MAVSAPDRVDFLYQFGTMSLSGVRRNTRPQGNTSEMHHCLSDETPDAMTVKEKLLNIAQKSPSSIKGLIARDSLRRSNPESYFDEIISKPFGEQNRIFKYQSFQHFIQHREIYGEKLKSYNGGKIPHNYEAVFNAFSKAAQALRQEVGL